MKWMEGWSWSDLCECPQEHRDEIVKLINEEAEEAERRSNG